MDAEDQAGYDQWQIHGCELAGEPYYFNGRSQQSRWTKPLELDFDVALENRARCARGRLGAVVARARDLYGLELADDANTIQTVETSREPYDEKRRPSDYPPTSEHAAPF